MASTAITTRRNLLRLIGAGGATVGLASCAPTAEVAEHVSEHDAGHGGHKGGHSGHKGHDKDTGAAPAPGTASAEGAPGSGPLNAGTTDTAPPGGPGTTTIMVIRHGEKPEGDDPPVGVTADGGTDKHSLTPAGWARAGALPGLFAPARGGPPAGLARPDSVYAAYGGDSDGLRPLQTVVPLAARLGQNVVIRHGKGDETGLATEIAARTGVTLVSWQHDGIPAIVARLGTITPAPPTSWPDARFDMVWVFTRDGAGWRFTQVPQLLLAGDNPQSIA